MKTEVLLRSIGKINDELIADAESEANTKRKPGWAKLGIMAACLALVLAVALVFPTLTRQDQSIITENEPKIELTLNEAMNDKTFGMLFPKQILEGYVLEDTPGIYGVSDYAELMKKPNSTVLEALFCNEEIGDEMRIRVASKEWFHSHEKESTETNTIHYNEHLVGVGSYIYFESGENIICYLFTTRDIAQIDGFCDMVNSASADTSSSISKFISLEEAKKIALKDAGLDEATQKIVFTREELNRNQGKPCYLLEFYTGTNQYFYQIDAKSGSIIYAGKFITLSEAKKIALDDAGCKDKVSFTEETLVSGGIKTPYYRLVFADAKTQWTYRIDAVLGIVLEKKQKETATTEIDTADFISLEEAKKIALKDAGLDEATQKIVFTREELNRNSGKPCYILEFYTAKKQYSYKVDAKNGSIMEAYHFILLADAKKIALDDAGVSEKVTFTEETLVAGGIKSPYYYFAFESASARWTYKIDAVLGVIMDKTCDKIIPPAPEFIGLEKAKQIALEDAGLDEATQKIVFTREELSRNSGKPCYILEFYTAKKQYSYKVDAKDGSIMEAYHFILLKEAKRIALDDAGVSEKVTFTEETLVAGGIKSPYYYFAFESASARWTYKIDAVLGVIMDKTCDKIIPLAPEFIGSEKAKQIALEDAGLDETAQKIVFTREELSRNSGKPCYILEFYTDKCAYSYKIDAVSGEVIGKKTEWFSRQESETVPDTSQNSDSKHR